MKVSGGDVVSDRLSQLGADNFRFSPDGAVVAEQSTAGHRKYSHPAVGRGSYLRVKFIADKVFALTMLPVVAVLAIGLLCLNPFLNRGPLFFIQQRMGRGCRPFTMIKFRTMLPAQEIARRPDDQIETDRITRLGHFLRKTRIDELPQVLNILKGEMSLIGPRPDYWDHAQHFITAVPGYRRRHAVLPGITGLAQVEAGYIESTEATAIKVRHDLDYIRRLGPGVEAYIAARTIRVVLTGSGAR